MAFSMYRELNNLDWRLLQELLSLIEQEPDFENCSDDQVAAYLQSDTYKKTQRFMKAHQNFMMRDDVNDAIGEFQLRRSNELRRSCEVGRH